MQGDHQKVMLKFPDFSLISLFSLIGGHPDYAYMLYNKVRNDNRIRNSSLLKHFHESI